MNSFHSQTKRRSRRDMNTLELQAGGKMVKTTIHISGGGDSSVGISPTESTITIDDNYGPLDDYLKEVITNFLIEFYDNGINKFNIEFEEVKVKQ